MISCNAIDGLLITIALYMIFSIVLGLSPVLAAVSTIVGFTVKELFYLFGFIPTWRYTIREILCSVITSSAGVVLGMIIMKGIEYGIN